MAMDFGKLSKMSVGEVAKTAATEGGAVAGGLIGAGFIGKQIEVKLKGGVVTTSPMTDKLIAYVANNGPKMALWYLLRKEKYAGEYSGDLGKGMLSSVVLDTIIRAGNSFAPKASLTLFGYDILGTGGSATNVTPQMQENLHKVLQENSSLRSQLSAALQRAASASSPNVIVTPVGRTNIANVQPVNTAQPNFPPDHDRAYGMMQTTPESEERRKNFGAMTPPIEDERNRRFGAMDKAKLNFAGDSQSIATSFGML